MAVQDMGIQQEFLEEKSRIEDGYILVVDDEKLVQKALMMTLAREGCPRLNCRQWTQCR